MTIILIGYDYIVLTKAIAEIWECSDIAMTKSDRAKDKCSYNQTGCKQATMPQCIILSSLFITCMIVLAAPVALSDLFSDDVMFWDLMN